VTVTLNNTVTGKNYRERVPGKKISYRSLSPRVAGRLSQLTIAAGLPVRDRRQRFGHTKVKFRPAQIIQGKAKRMKRHLITGKILLQQIYEIR